MVNALVVKPLNPLRTPVLFNIKPPILSVLRVPVPESVPFNVTLLVNMGLLPRGKLQSLLTVLIPEGWEIATRLNVALLHAKTAVEPSNITVPPLALNVEPALRVKPVAKVALPLGAVNTPPEFKVNVLFTSNVE